MREGEICVRLSERFVAEALRVHLSVLLQVLALTRLEDEVVMLAAKRQNAYEQQRVRTCSTAMPNSGREQ